MRKFKVVKKWPGGPEVGLIGELGLENVSFTEASNYKRWHTLEELEGFVEEVEPEGFWWVNFYNHSKVEKSDKYGAVCVDPSARFRTKESAEKFAKALKKTKERNSYLSTTSIFELDKAYIQDILDALNDRVTD